MVMLDVLRQQPDLDLLVAHADHGLRTDSSEDLNLVKNYCLSNGLAFVSKKLKLKNKSEDFARQARYDFLQSCSKKFNAASVVTAHHQDDLIETAMINILRGTGWRGIAPFAANDRILRPFLTFTKDQIIGYARANEILWREDSTNTDESYLRNFVRLTLIPACDQKSDSWRATLLQLVLNQQDIRSKIESEIATVLQNKNILSRYNLIMLPRNIAIELVKEAYKKASGQSLTQRLAQDVLLFAKVAKPGKVMLIGKTWQATVSSKVVSILPHNFYDKIS